ncbi:SMC-Scp complex subunit ScpB [Megasphaera paucivorans]|uniref:Segregation and condensation protein B n=1 Tax=Megasphaera paucivorans TaxID=349095 RepID=A0A1G9TGR0_9FIRM|nr:SMC-Scp complex subunit ScpB [Megasphaera paucivorans]SDM46979.1 segregation and condensation protein B [Megasphaera paucivorans]
MGIPLPYDLFQKEKHEPTAVMEALLFLSGQPMSIADLCEHTGWTETEVTSIAETLRQLLSDQNRGIMLIRVSGGYQLVTKPELHDMIKWVRTGHSQLSPMALEVLAIIAFKQPVTRAEVEKIRGVSSERIMYSLMQQGLIVDLGRKDSPGRPIIYGTSPYFLECLGMNSLAELAGQVPAKEKITVVEMNQNQENKEGEIPVDGELHK